MPEEAPRVTGQNWRSAALFLVGSAIFALAYGQAPLYFSNQNQYFLHGLAAAGHGSLEHDWLAGTADTTPLFSLLVQGTYQAAGEMSFYFYYALLMGVYLASLVGLFRVLAGAQATTGATLVFVALLVLVHSALVRSLSSRLLGVDYPWYFQAGLAGQYVLGPMLQPSAFGVLLVLSLCLFARGQSVLAVACSALGAVCHSTYLLPAALLTVGYMGVLWREKQVRQALLLGGLALAMVAPALVYNAVTFWPTTPEKFAEAQRLLVHFRIPHHTLPQLWFDEIAGAQVGWMALGIVLVRGSRLFLVLVIVFVLACALTVIQVVSGSDALALLFPWRISVIVLPVATTIILSRVVLLCADHLPAAWVWAGSAALLAVTVVGGVVIMALGLAYQERDEELDLMAHVKAHHAPGDLFLLPVPIPNLKESVRGAAKSDFRPLPALQASTQFIPVNLQRFRLYTGAPIYVDFKSIPYRDEDVLEWHERLLLNEKFHEKLKAGQLSSVLPELRTVGITHIVVPTRHEFSDPQLEEWYSDQHYRVYRLLE